MKKSKYVWHITHNLIVLFLTMAIYNTVYGRYETIVISLLILIYLNLVLFSQGTSLTFMKFVIGLVPEIVKIKELLGHEDDEIEEDLKDATNKYKSEEIKVRINAIFSVIIYVIVIINLLGSL